MHPIKYQKVICGNRMQDLLMLLYGEDTAVQNEQKERYMNAIDSFCKHFPERNDIHIYSAPGRTEIGGNHTDHQQGVVLAGAVNLDAIGVVSFHNDSMVRVYSEGYGLFCINLNDLKAHPGEAGTACIVKGILAKYLEHGVQVGGFDLYCTSDVICGGGISSSAAFETLICTLVNNHYNNGKHDPFEIAKIGWFAENEFFGKQCGLLDQTVSSFGGLISIDFRDHDNPVIEQIEFDFAANGYCLCITDTKSSHENLTEDYDAIRNEMRQIAEYFGCNVLNEVDEKQFYNSIPYLRKRCSDRAVLRAMHFFDETKRARQEADALKENRIADFLQLVNESGDSSCALLQNLYTTKAPANQEIPLAIALSKRVLGKKGAVRVHGGGFAGTIQAFVPLDMVEQYIREMENVFGKGSCHKLKIRPVGGIVL